MDLKPSEIRYQKVVEHTGVWGDKAMEGAKCRIIISDLVMEGITAYELSQYNASAYFSANFNGTLVVGESDTSIDRAIEEIVQTMLPQEMCLVIIFFQPKKAGFGQALVKFKISLLGIENEPPFFEWDDERKFQTAMHHKLQGVELHKAGQHLDAFFRFSKALKMVISVAPIGEADDSKQQAPHVTQLRATLYNNLAMCQLRFNNFMHVVTLCNRSLAFDPNNVKALYRRAVAFIGFGEFNLARDDLNRVLQLEPDNTAAINKQLELKTQEKQLDSHFAQVAKKMLM